MIDFYEGSTETAREDRKIIKSVLEIKCISPALKKRPLTKKAQIKGLTHP